MVKERVMVRGFVQTIVISATVWCLAATAEGDQSPADLHDKAGDQAILISDEADKTPSCPVLTRIRLYPRQGFALRMLRGRFSGSNADKTTNFEAVAAY
jgi:hypothetical protein